LRERGNCPEENCPVGEVLEGIARGGMPEMETSEKCSDSMQDYKSLYV